MGRTPERKISQPADQKPHLVTQIPGPKSVALRAREEAHYAPGHQRYSAMAGIVVDKARGNTVTDVDGNTFLDIVGAIGVNGLGHSHPKWTAAIAQQVQNVSAGSFSSNARVELMERVASHAPSPGVHRLQLYSGGAEAVESALRLAKCYTGKSEFVSFWGGFHGKTMGVLSLMGSDFKKGLGPLVPGNHLVPYANCYRCPLKLKYPSCGMACVELAEGQVRSSTSGSIAAFLVEPMLGAGGNNPPPKEFLPAVKAMAKKFDALLIVDEMITGFGRTGKYWGSEHTGTAPDIVTIGKQFGGGLPVTGLISRDDIVQSKPWANPSGSSSSYGGNPLASAAAAASLRIIDEEELVENARRMGEYFLGKLQPFLDDYPFVGDVRGQGLLLALELVKSKETKELLPRSVCKVMFEECLKRGLICLSFDPVFRIQPAMTIDEATIDTVVAILREVFDGVKKQGQWSAA